MGENLSLFYIDSFWLETIPTSRCPPALVPPITPAGWGLASTFWRCSSAGTSSFSALNKRMMFWWWVFISSTFTSSTGSRAPKWPTPLCWLWCCTAIYESGSHVIALAALQLWRKLTFTLGTCVVVRSSSPWPRIKSTTPPSKPWRPPSCSSQTQRWSVANRLSRMSTKKAPFRISWMENPGCSSKYVENCRLYFFCREFFSFEVMIDN